MVNKDSFWKRPPPLKKKESRFGGVGKVEKKKPRIEYTNKVHVVEYKHKKLKTFKGPSAKEEAKALIARKRAKDPNNKYTLKTERIPKRRLF